MNFYFPNQSHFELWTCRMILNLSVVKVSKSKKQFFFVLCLAPKNERKSSILVYQASRIDVFRSIFGRIENKKIAFEIY